MKSRGKRRITVKKRLANNSISYSDFCENSNLEIFTREFYSPYFRNYEAGDITHVRMPNYGCYVG